MKTNTKNPYADIINLPRPKAAQPMSIAGRAAQFSPYAALVGHKDIITHDELEASAKVNLDDSVTVELDPPEIIDDF